MTIDVRGGAVRLDNAEFLELVQAPSPEVLQVPVMPEALAAVRRPLVEVSIVIAGAHAVARHHVWLDQRAALFLLTLKGESRQLLPMPAALVPSGLARCVRLRPEEAPDRERRPVTAADLDAVLVSEDGPRRSALDVLGADLVWTMSAHWNGGAHRVLVVRRPDGLWLALPADEEEWELQPVTSTQVWRRLSSILPTPDQLDLD